MWSKKKQRDKKELGLSEEEIRRRERERKREADEELAKLNKRRAEREREMELREQERTRKQREAELAQMGEWELKEEEVTEGVFTVRYDHILINFSLLVPFGTSQEESRDSYQRRQSKTHRLASNESTFSL